MRKAVITGDIIHSTQINAEQRNILFERIANALKQWDNDFNMRSETFRGDSFQCVIDRPKLALRIVLIQKTFIRSLNPSELFKVKTQGKSNSQKKKISPPRIFDARIVIGIGEVEYLSNRLASSGGEAFQLSGELLDSMKNKKQSIGIATNDKYNDELTTEFKLLDALISKTSAFQCQVIFQKLLGFKEQKIAEKLNIHQSAVNQRSMTGNWNAIETMLNRFEKIYSDEE
ncbi:MAG: hypothetical protein IM571_12980 [Chitinophagaceae bacterium]|jgi:hypothetical protein|nr:hypothetical protein [Flavobacterium sp.]MCA6443461.1 hypothetical protein [Bacteroidota bacterium]MCA6462418.1 hypothetical protein [Chitinophagaceae bacterium]MCA6471875.1 hypothetical protein [Chitinophagaceae bacterium]MCA6478850.1 hypothetical protein [Chitinophagaceae bacterium]